MHGRQAAAKDRQGRPKTVGTALLSPTQTSSLLGTNQAKPSLPRTSIQPLQAINQIRPQQLVLHITAMQGDKACSHLEKKAPTPKFRVTN